jgi:hypothetical protein
MEATIGNFAGLGKAKATKKAKPARAARPARPPQVKALKKPVAAPLTLPAYKVPVTATLPYVPEDPADPAPRPVAKQLVVRTKPISIEQQEGAPGQGRFSKTLDVISQGIDAFTNRNNIVGPGAGGPNRETLMNDGGAGLATEAGATAGGFIDSLFGVAQRHPAEVALGLIGIGLYFIVPSSGGYQRRR